MCPSPSWKRTGCSGVAAPVDYHLAFGVYPDMTERGADRDDWPMLYEKVHAADILVIGSPIWLGEKSSVCTQVIERLYSCSALLGAAQRCGMDWRGVRRVGERVHSAQHHVHDVEPDALRPHAQGRGGYSGSWESARRLGCRVPVRSCES